MKRLLVFALVGCSTLGADVGDEPAEQPSPEPPLPWGVPISGGTLAIVAEGTAVIVADPDRDRVISVELPTGRVIAEHSLAPQSEPGRVIEDGAGRIHVAMRRGGNIVSYASASLDEAMSRPVCAEPRGLAWDAATDVVFVACASGELVSVPAAGGPPIRTMHLERDLRDVLVRPDGLLVTRFRSAEILSVSVDGLITSRVVPPTVKRVDNVTDPMHPTERLAPPAVAWRAIAASDGRILIAHQRQVDGPLIPRPGGYQTGCGGGGPAESAIAVIEPGQPIAAMLPRNLGALPVDIAVSPSGAIVVASAGSQSLFFYGSDERASRDDDKCGARDSGADQINVRLGSPTAIAYASDEQLVAFYPELPALVILDHEGVTSRTIELPGEIGYDTGRALFHRQTNAGVACASCHPEGREDGLVWKFEDVGPRRTQSLAGKILDRAPYHWGGDLADLPTLMHTVFGERMSGGQLSRSQLLSLGPWLQRIQPPAPGPAPDGLAVARGQAIFESSETGCTSCHAGPLLTNRSIVDVGRGSPTKTPSLLGVGARAPFLHDGSASTLSEVFSAFNLIDKHGMTTQLSPAALADLTAYLESL